MLRKLTLLLVGFTLCATAFSQVGQGALKGKVTDGKSGEPLAFANVVILLNGNQVAYATTDFDGKYTIKPVTPGKYTIQATYIGYQNKQINGVQINSDKTTYLDLKLSEGGVDLEAFEVIEYEVPLISKDQTSSGGTVTREDIAKMPGRSATSVAATVGGVFTQDNGQGDVSIRGGRSNATVVFIDGIKVRGSQSLPNAAIEQVTVLTGGLPAQYGDATGGAISITTRGPSKQYFGGIEYLTSGFPFQKRDDAGNRIDGRFEGYGLDKFAYNLLGFNIAGPLMFRKDTAGEKTDPLFGFFLSGELRYQLDPRPSAIGDWVIKDSVLQNLIDDPLRPSGLASGGSFSNGEFLRASDFEPVKARQNVSNRSLNLAGKIDVSTSATTNLTFGGTLNMSRNYGYNRSRSLFNYYNNAEINNYTYRVYGRFTQRFANATDEDGEEGESDAGVKNAFISIQVDFSQNGQLVQNANHQDRFAEYGFYGKFFSEFENSYGFSTFNDTINNASYTGNIHNGFNQLSYSWLQDSLVNPNPVLANYNNVYYSLYDDITGNYETPIQVQQGGGLLNGESPRNIYDMWISPGAQYNQYRRSQNRQFRVQASGSADIKNHALLIGFEYEQRVDRFYDLRPQLLWRTGRQLINNHIQQLDEQNYWVTYEGSAPTVTFERLYDAASHSTFDKNVRERLGFDVTGTDWIDFDAYGPMWKVEDFSADELINGGTNDQRVFYAGYDHKGDVIKGIPSLDDFFNDTYENGDFKRYVPAFRPIYVAGYIQDKFSFDDLIFNIGVRVDRFDANQPVLKDQYSLFPTVKAGEVDFEHPSNIGDDYVVYVGDIEDPSSDDIVGYRNGDTWYNADGVEIIDPSVLETATGIAPWLVDPTKTSTVTDLSSASFEDYKPQVNVMPRIAFSFPISDEALFFAHYDVLTQRPPERIRMNPIDYMFIQSHNRLINNPNLKPEKTIDYEIGFQQKLNSKSSLKIAAFYREMRNQIQVRQIFGAYPESYLTMGNIDFGTVKGATIAYDLRRSGNFKLRANYTLQFAEGTGSGTTSQFNLVNSGQPNLRTIFPLGIDQRHAIQLAGDYSFAAGKNYNGPKWFGKDIFENAGVNLTANLGSGTPYTKRDVAVPSVLFSGQSNSVEGSINGSRLPWTFTTNARVYKDFTVKFGKAEEGEDERKSAALNVYLQVLNILNTKNVLSVYNVTGNPDDDGYLAAAAYQPFIASQNDEQSFRDLYTIKLANPGFYSLPRRIRLGCQLNF